VTFSYDMDAMKPQKTLRCMVGLTLLSAFVASWFVWGPFGLIFYVAGLFNSVWVFVLGPFLLLLIPAAALFGFVQMMRTALHWQELACREKWCRVTVAAVLSAFVLSFGLGFAGLVPVPFDAFARGFGRCVERRADVAAIQNWLSTLDPNICRNEGGYAQDHRLATSEQPPCLASLGAEWATLEADDKGHLKVRLLWGGGMIGHWGIVVGRPDMPIAPPDASDGGESQMPLAPGAYIWFRD
jgi:hypothetical protein